MKLILTGFRQGAIALAFLVLGSAGWAQDFSKTAVVDYNTILKEYYKAKDSQKQMEDLAANYQKERNERDAALKTIVDAINGLQKDMQDPAISDAKKKEKENQLKAKGEEGQVKQREMMAFAQTASKILEDKRQRLTTELTEDVNKALSQVAKNKYNMVFVKPQIPSPGALIYADGMDDVTAQVLGILNKEAPAAKKEDKKDEKK
ncbi:MAG: OmpH family outer membrane protein [Verrucomicrobia bacterium]|jgi:Skp family chaperone for outer membrane proteins|nr:OmpH family outer membrane protein [Verrucomicrobiota bacterium]